MIERREVTYCDGCLEDGVAANCRLLSIELEAAKNRCDRCLLPTWNGVRLTVEVGHSFHETTRAERGVK